MFYQITLKGFESDGSQDHLVKWIKAPSENAVRALVEKTGLNLDTEQNEDGKVDSFPEDFDIEDGIDVVVNQEGEILRGSIGQTEPLPVGTLRPHR